MKSSLLRFVWVVAGILVGASPVRAQVLGLGLSVKPSATSVLVSNSITYTINLTNLTGLALGNAYVTNSFSTPARVQDVSFTVGSGVNYTGVAFTNNAAVILDFKQFNPVGAAPGFAQATVTVVPEPGSFGTNGFFTNAVVASAPEVQFVPNSATTNVVVQVTNTVFQADLALSVSGFPQGILAGDTVSYRATVSNRGPDAVPNVLLTNTLPAGTTLISTTPRFQTSTLNNGVTVLSLGTLSNATAAAITFTVQPTNAGAQIFALAAGTTGLVDPNPTNNFFSTNIVIGAVITGQVIATNASAMALNPQTGLMEQTVRLVNVSTSTLASVRLTVSHLTNWLYNAVGTNNNNPFAVYANTLNPNQSVDLILEYFVPTRIPIEVGDTNYTALGVPAINLTAPGNTNSVFSITRTVLLPDGSLLIEFPSVPGASYSVLYSTNADFSNPLIAQPSITAPADRVQWIDDGPPKTVSPPASVSSRFYRVLRN